MNKEVARFNSENYIGDRDVNHMEITLSYLYYKPTCQTLNLKTRHTNSLNSSDRSNR